MVGRLPVRLTHRSPRTRCVEGNGPVLLPASGGLSHCTLVADGAPRLLGGGYLHLVAADFSRFLERGCDQVCSNLLAQLFQISCILLRLPETGEKARIGTLSPPTPDQISHGQRP